MRSPLAAARSTSPGIREVPGLGGLEALAAVPRWRADPFTFFEQLVETHGDVARFQLGPIRLIALRRPEHIQHVLQLHHRRYDKSSRGYNVMREVFGTGLLTSEGSHWKRQRRIVQPTFHRRYVEGFATTIDDETSVMLERWRGRDTIAAHDEMTEATLRIVVRTLFGMDLEANIAELSASLDGMVTALRDRIVHARLPWSVPTPRNRRQRKHVDAIARIIDRLIERRRRAGLGNDLLSMLMAAQSDRGESMNDDQLRDEVLTLFLAGHDTTANTLAWTWFLLSRHPLVAERLRAEVDEVLTDEPVTLEQLGRLDYTGAVIAEVLRLYPPAWVVPRRALEADEIGGCRIRAGDTIAAMPFLAHRHPAYWTNPEGFDPGRFADGPPTGDARFSYIPFGAGPRLCVGKALAEMEAKIVVARVVQRTRLDLVGGQVVRPRAAITLKPSSPLHMRLSWR